MGRKKSVRKRTLRKPKKVTINKRKLNKFIINERKPKKNIISHNKKKPPAKPKSNLSYASKNVMVNLLDTTKEERLSGLDRAGCWSLKECVTQFQDNMSNLEKLNIINIMCLLKESDRMDENLIQLLTASHLQTAKNIKPDNVRYYYDIANQEYSQIRSEYLPLCTIEEQGCKMKLYTALRKTKLCIHAHILHNINNDNESITNKRPKRSTKSIYKTILDNKNNNSSNEKVVQCTNEAVSCSNYCLKHIYMDDKQYLFKRCQYGTSSQEDSSEITIPCNRQLLLRESNGIYCDKHYLLNCFNPNNQNKKRIIDLPNSSINEIYKFLTETTESNRMTPTHDENNPIKSNFDMDKSTEQN